MSIIFRSIRRYLSSSARSSTRSSRLRERIAQKTDTIKITVAASERIKTILEAVAEKNLTNNKPVSSSKCSTDENKNMNSPSETATTVREEPEVADGVRLGIRSGGCNGLEYTINYSTNKNTDVMDVTVYQHSVKVVVDKKALFYLVGTTMDYQEDDLRAGFVFDNPNVKSTCGCEQSFTV